MTIEPSNVRFTIGTKVIGPKQAKTIPQPKLSMAEDAKLCNRRMWSAMGRTNYECGPAEAANAKRSAEALAAREELALRILDMMKGQRLTRSQIEEAFSLTDNQARVVLKHIRDTARAGWRRGPKGVALWEAIE